MDCLPTKMDPLGAHLFPIRGSKSTPVAEFEIQSGGSKMERLGFLNQSHFSGVMRNTAKAPLVLIATSQSGLLTHLRESNATMDTIWHSLESYLDSKRMRFPRFFFLSNEEIFEIMSQIHDPTSIEPYLSKCFDKISGLVFSQQKSEVNGMINVSGETLKFSKPVTIDGPVEGWLVSLEDAMKKNVEAMISKALADYSRMNPEQWIFYYPSQITLTVSLIAWTRKIHLALEKENPREHLQQVECTGVS